MKRNILICAAILLLSSCGQLEINPLPTDSINKKSENKIMSEVYSQAMKYNEAGEPKNYCSDKDLAISSETDSYGFLETDQWQQITKHLSQLEQSTWDNFVRVQSRRIPFPSDLDLGCKYTLVDEKIKQSISSNCVKKFSQIGFNNKGDQALVILTE